eukprot:COSAG06_NODE_64271_length_260_cov_0.602484_2_plen_29_part_01
MCYGALLSVPLYSVVGHGIELSFVRAVFV